MKGLREIRLYPNRRLYDPKVAGYITFDDVFALVQERVPLRITTTKSGSDCTDRVLLDLVVRHELSLTEAQQPLLTGEFLQELIRLGAGERALLAGEFLKHSMAHLEGAGKSLK